LTVEGHCSASAETPLGSLREETDSSHPRLGHRAGQTLGAHLSKELPMTTLTLPELAKKMAGIDFTMLQTHANGQIAGRPMSNNGDVDYDGDSWFFTMEDTDMVREISADPNVALGLTGSKSLLGKPPLFVHVQGRATLIRDRGTMAQHWVKDLERWFEQGVDTPGLVLIHVHASRIHYWDGEDEGEIVV
jgi:general stress protein 26